MSRKVTGWDYRNKRFYNDFCEKCKFITCVVTFFDDDTLEFHDVYESCQGTGWIIVRSNEAGDYWSGINQKSLFAHYIESMENY